MALDIEKELKIYWICNITVEFYLIVLYFIVIGGDFLILGASSIPWAIVLIRLYKDIDNWEKIENWVLFRILWNIVCMIVYIIWITVLNMLISLDLLSAIIVLSWLIIAILFAIVGIHIWVQKRK